MRFLLVFCIFCYINISSQNRGNIWLIDGHEINFNNPRNTTINKTSNTINSQASICDKNGKILALYDGINLYDAKENVIKSNKKFGKAYNSVLFKKVGCNSEYYLFETKALYKPDRTRAQPQHVIAKLYYSLFDIDDIGNITIIEEDILYSETPLYSGLTSYVNNETEKVWVIVRNGNNMFTIEVNERGPQKAKLSKLGGPKIFTHSTREGNFVINALNDIKITPEGDKIISFIRSNGFISLRDSKFVRDNGYTHIVSFNKQTGEAGDFFSETRIEKKDTAVDIFYPFMGEVKGDKLYVGTTVKFLPFGLPPIEVLFQYDLSKKNIKETEKNIFRRNLVNFFDIQIAPDGELYFLTVGGVGGGTFLARIEGDLVNPILDTSNFRITELPSFPQSYFKSDFFVKNLCFGENIDFSVDLIEEPINFSWSFGDGNNSTLEIPTHKYQDPGNYEIELNIEDAKGNINRYTKNVVIKEELISTTLPKEVFKCSNIKDVELDAGLFETFLWSTGENTRKIRVEKPGKYTVLVGNKDCCVGELETLVIENIAPIIEEVVYNELENEVTINVKGVAPLTYVLDGDLSQKENVFNELSFGTHSIEVIDANGCRTEREFEVSLTIPSFFSPNGDGENDIFKVPQLRGDLDFEFTIYDRFRRDIKTFKNEEVYWDGTFQGEQLVSDDYWYYLKVNEQVFKGHFSKLK